MIKPRNHPAQLPSHWVKVNDWEMHYRTAGSGIQAVVLIHGLSVSGTYLLPTAQKLQINFTVYIPDLPGFGASEKPRHVLDIPEMAETLIAWMDVVGLDRVYLLGNSLGCHTVAYMAARHPQRVAGIILVSPVGDPGEHNTLRLVARALNDFVREPPSLWAIMWVDYLKAGFRRTVLTLRNLQQCQLEPLLPRIAVPSLVVRGRRDRIVPRWWTDRVAELLPRSRLMIIQDAAHVPNFSHPARLTALVRAFMENGHDREVDA